MNVFSKTLLSSALAAATLSAIALPSTSFAATDEKIFPGTVCQSVFDKDYPVTYELGTGAAANYANSRLYVVCPLVRDTVLKPWVNVKVTVYDYDTTDSVACTVYNANSNGDSSNVYYKSSPVSSNSFTGRQIFNFGKLSASHSRGAYFMTCRVPANGSKIASILLEEE